MDPSVCYPFTMESKPKVILNCRSPKTVLPALQKALQEQIHPFELELLPSTTCPSRLSQIENENKIYFFFDEDVNLPSPDHLEKITSLFKKNPQLLFLGGKYLTHPNQSYLAKCYNTQIELWLFTQSENNNGLVPCQNLPGGAWIISGKIKKHLQDWKEPEAWAGEDTFSIRWLQKKGIQTFHHTNADVLHYPRSHFTYFCKRAYLQGRARELFDLKSQKKMSLKLIWKYRMYWPGWALHQFFVEAGSFLFKIESLTAKTTPKTSPIA